MKITGAAAIINFLGVLLMACPSTAKAVTLPANEPATIYYTTNGADPAMIINTDSLMTTLPESGESTSSVSAFDGYYTLSSINSNPYWDGTYADRLKMPTTDYAYTYGDEASITYTLPVTFGSFSFYGQSFSQINVDTNGNIWFGSSGSAHSFNLASNGRGPVIAAWNNDLSSYLTGGVFIQHKTSPERVVIEWQTETYNDEGRRRPHNFEVVLYQTGNIRLDYGSFTTSTTNKDFGSGVSFNDGSLYVNLTENAGNVYSLGGQSFLLSTTGTTKALTVNNLPYFGGSVTSNVGATWNTYSTKFFPVGTNIVLTGVPQYAYHLGGWDGCGCSGTGTCSFTLTGNASVTAMFLYEYTKFVTGFFPDGTSTLYTTLQEAYNGAVTNSILKLREAILNEGVNFNQAKSVTIKGGYDDYYIANTAGESVVSGSLTIASGTVVIDNLSIR